MIMIVVIISVVVTIIIIIIVIIIIVIFIMIIIMIIIIIIILDQHSLVSVYHCICCTGLNHELDTEGWTPDAGTAGFWPLLNRWKCLSRGPVMLTPAWGSALWGFHGALMGTM